MYMNFLWSIADNDKQLSLYCAQLLMNDASSKCSWEALQMYEKTEGGSCYGIYYCEWSLADH